MKYFAIITSISLLFISCTNSNSSNDPKESYDTVNEMVQAYFAQQNWTYETIPTNDQSTHFIVNLSGRTENMVIHVVVNRDINHYIIVGTPVDTKPITKEMTTKILQAINNFNLNSRSAFATLGDHGALIISCGVNTDNNTFSLESFHSNLSAVTTAIDLETTKILNTTNL